MNTVATIVVTYNRKVLLRECIEALLKSYVKSDIIIIDNNSTDGTKDYILDLIDDKSIVYKRLKDNLGGAGGFSVGINYAVRQGYKYVWIMDDDTIVKHDTLSILLDKADKLNDNFGFLSSSVKWIDGSDCKMNMQSYASKPKDALNYLIDDSLRLVKSATFVSLLINSYAVKGVGLPKAKYYIWGDDKEYTLRMSKYFNCYHVTDSIVTHKMKSNTGSNITTDDIDRIDRYFYAYRNDFATARDNGIMDVMIYMAAFMLNVLRVIMHSPDNKAKRLTTMLRGLAAGVYFKVPVRYIR